VGALVYFEVLGAGEDFSAAWKGTGKRLFAGVHAYVVHQLVFGLEGLPGTRTVQPEASVVRHLRPAHVFDGDMGHYLVHRAKQLVARLTGLYGLKMRTFID